MIHRLFIPASWLLICVLAANAAAALSGEQAETLRQAQKQLNTRRYDEAVATLRTWIEARPDAAEAHRLLGHALFEQGKMTEARQAFTQAIEHGRMTPAMLGRLVRIHRQRGDPLGAISALHELLLLKPGSHEWAVLYGQMLHSLGATEQAAAVYRALLKRRPADAALMQRLGGVRLEQGQTEQAAMWLAAAYFCGRAAPPLARTLGDLHLQRDQPEAALRWYTRALNDGKAGNDPNDPGALRLRRARLLYRLERYEDATRALKSLLQQRSAGREAGEPTLAAKAHQLYGHIALAQHQPGLAVRHWRRAAEAGLADAQILAYLGRHYFNAARYAKAARWLTQRLETGPPARTLRRSLVLSLLRTDQPERARRHLQRYLERYPLDEQARHLIERWRKVPAPR